MTKPIKSTVMVIAGFCWFGFALLICFFVFQYLMGGAGLQVFGFFFPVSAMTAVIGLVHFIGFVAAAVICFAIGVGLCAYGLAPATELQKKKLTSLKERFVMLRKLIVGAPEQEESESALRCVRCRGVLAKPVELCPECGWTQPRDRGCC